MNKVIILGSSRSDGDTKSVVENIIEKTDWDLIDLSDYDFGYYDYNHLNREDDFLDLMRMILSKYDTLIFATPVYWYSMSGILKVFFDRITDLLTIETDLGRKLRGKNMAVISCSNGNNLGEAFWLPFKVSAEYLGISYLADMHSLAGHVDQKQLEMFITKVEIT